MTKTAPASKTPNRDLLKATYLKAFDNFATTAVEVAEGLGITTKEATVLLREMENSLLASTHVNNERTLTWQCWDTYDSITRRQAIAKFNKVFPTGVEVELNAPKATGRKGATGPRYTAEQIVKGHQMAVEAARSGKKLTNKEIAEACGVKSPAYFSKVRREMGAKLLRKSRRVVRRSTKAAA
jgi:hypothetical protein